MNDSDETILELEHARRVALGDRRTASIPLIVFGVLVLLSAPFMGELSLWRLLFWSLAGPIGFVVAAVWYRHRKLTLGIGSGRVSYRHLALGLLAAFVLVLPLTAVQLPVIGLVLLGIGLRQHNSYLSVGGICFALLGGLAQFGVFANPLYRVSYEIGLYRAEGGYFGYAQTIVFVVLGLLMLGAGLIALKLERRDASG